MTNNDNQIKNKIAHLGKTIAPNDVPSHLRLLTFQQVRSLLEYLPNSFIKSLILLKKPITNIRKKIDINSLNDTRNEDNFAKIKKNQQLTTHPYLATIFSPIPSEWKEIKSKKYRSYQALIFLACLQLHILGQHNSLIKSSLREIRLIATDLNHVSLLDTLPSINEQKSLKQLIAEIAILRKTDLESILSRGLGYIYNVLSQAVDLSKGILRHRTPSFKPEKEEDIELIEQPYSDDKDISVVELKAKKQSQECQFDETDEPLDIQSGQTFRVHIPSTATNSLALKAIQGQRVVEQLTIRHQSHPCSINQCSDWDIQHLITDSIQYINSSNKDSKTATILLLILFTGRNLDQLQNAISQQNILQVVKQRPCIVLKHNVPASKQKEELNSILLKTTENLFLALPGQINITSIQHELAFSSDKIRQLLDKINKRHQTRLTMGRIAGYLEHWYINQGRDRAEIALIKGALIRSRAALSYTNWDVKTVTDNYNLYLVEIFKSTVFEPLLPEKKEIKSQLGSRLHLPDRVIKDLFAHIAN
ncbi:MAG: hypothetical protein HAW67_01755, partial [Endozoicomonadaceae bacterium]|nr:hypothetical protein [Endozoicomonadaceae bacterium]